MLPFHHTSHHLDIDEQTLSFTPTQQARRVYERGKRRFKAAALTLPLWLFLPFVFEALQGLWLLLPVMGFGMHIHIATQQLYALTQKGSLAMTTHLSTAFDVCERTTRRTTRKWWQRKRREIKLDTQPPLYVRRLAPKQWALCVNHDDIGDIVLAIAAHQPPLIEAMTRCHHGGCKK